MPLALLAFALPCAPLARDLRPGRERKYRVEVRQDAGDEFFYRLRLRMVETKVAKIGKSESRLDARLTDYRGTMDGQKVSARLIGGGQMAFETSGVPAGLSVVGPQGPVWLPLLALAFPGGEEGDFDLPATDVGAGLRFVGHGTLARKDGQPRITLDASLSRAESALGKVTITTTLDGDGWPKRAEGTLVSADGTYRFLLARA